MAKFLLTKKSEIEKISDWGMYVPSLMLIEQIAVATYWIDTNIHCANLYATKQAF